MVHCSIVSVWKTNWSSWLLYGFPDFLSRELPANSYCGIVADRQDRYETVSLQFDGHVARFVAGVVEWLETTFVGSRSAGVECCAGHKAV